MAWLPIIAVAVGFGALIAIMVITMKEDDEYWEEYWGKYRRGRKH